MRKNNLTNNEMIIKEEKSMRKKLMSLHKDQGGFDLIVSIMILAVMVGMAMLFRDQLTAFVDRLFAEILAF